MNRAILPFLIALALAPQGAAKGLKHPDPKRSPFQNVGDCLASVAQLPREETRIYVVQRGGIDGSGRSLEDARDGSTVDKFDRILRCYSEGCQVPGEKPIKPTENLIVCLGPGTFSTRGTYDYVINVPHTTAQGFTVGKGWKIHGAGADRTTVKLVAYLPLRQHQPPRNSPVNAGLGVVFGTNSDQASAIEISDLAIDANYPELKRQATSAGIKALNLEAIHLRSDQGGHWIHDLRIINTAGEIGAIDGHWETFPVWIVSVKNGSVPQENNGNVVERVSMSDFGGGACTAIAMANAIGEIRNNTVEGYGIAFGGWSMGPVWFHDNTALNTEYGFNIDSLRNEGVRIERNRIIHPRKYGIVIGGEGTYANFRIIDNAIEIDRSGIIGVIFQGNVTGAEFRENSILASPGVKAVAISNYSAGLWAKPNVNNVYQSNRISSGLRVVFKGLSWTSRSCIAGNQDENGNQSKRLRDNRSGPCSEPK